MDGYKLNKMDKVSAYDVVEPIVCEKVGVVISSMFEEKQKGACVKARHLSIFILHNRFKVSIRDLKNRYGYASPRAVFKINKQMRDYIEYNNQYRELFNDAVRAIEAKLEMVSVLKC